MKMLKKRIENLGFFLWLTCVFYQTDLKHLRVYYFFLNVFLWITLHYIIDLNQNLDQILSSWLTQDFIVFCFIFLCCLELLAFSILIFLCRNSSLDEDFRVIFIWIFVFSLFVFIPVLFIFGSISENLYQKKDVLLQSYFHISNVERIMLYEEAYQVFQQIVKGFPHLNYLSLNELHYEFKVKVYSAVFIEANFSELFNNCYAAAPTRPRFVRAVLGSLELYWEQIQNPVFPTLSKKKSFLKLFEKCFILKTLMRGIFIHNRIDLLKKTIRLWHQNA